MEDAQRTYLMLGVGMAAAALIALVIGLGFSVGRGTNAVVAVELEQPWEDLDALLDTDTSDDEYDAYVEFDGYDDL